MDFIKFALSFALMLIVIFWLFSSIVITKNKTVAIIETFGKFSGLRQAGLSLKLPAPFQTVAAILPMYIQESKVKLELKTKDNLFIEYPVIVQFKITDPRKANYELQNPHQQILSYISNLVRSEVGKRTFLELYSVRNEIQEEIQHILAEKMSGFGFEIVDVLVNEPIPTQDVQDSYNSVTASERQKESAKNLAEAKRITLVAEAQAQKESKKLQGEGIASQRKAIAEGFKDATEDISKALGISNDMAVFMILQLNKFDTIRDAANGQGTIIITDGSSDSELREMQKMLGSIVATKKKLEHVDLAPTHPKIIPATKKESSSKVEKEIDSDDE